MKAKRSARRRLTARRPEAGLPRRRWSSATSEIDYPKAIKPDLVLAMNQKACDSYCYDLKPGGLIIVDGTLVKDLPTPRAIALPFTQIARQELGREMVANIVALGALAKISGIVTVDSLEKAVLARVPAGTEELNRRALAAGVEAAAEFLLGRSPHCVEAAEKYWGCITRSGVLGNGSHNAGVYL